MTSPMDFFLKTQTAMGEGMIKFVIQNMRSYEHCLALYSQWLNHPNFVRLQDFIPNGADWLDHYGKRHHDVDVEKV